MEELTGVEIEKLVKRSESCVIYSLFRLSRQMTLIAKIHIPTKYLNMISFKILTVTQIGDLFREGTGCVNELTATALKIKRECAKYELIA